MMESPEHDGYPRVTYTHEEGFTFKDVAPKTYVRKDTLTLEETLKYGRTYHAMCLAESVCRDVELLKTTVKLNGNNYIADMCDYVMDDLNRIRSILSEDRNDILDKEE